MNLITTSDKQYILLVDEYAKREVGDYYAEEGGYGCYILMWTHSVAMKHPNERGKVIAHYPTTLFTKDLPLPFLPIPDAEPIGFNPTYEIVGQCSCRCHQPGVQMRHIVACCHPTYNLITGLNSEGKEELIGKYTYL